MTRRALKCSPGCWTHAKNTGFTPYWISTARRGDSPGLWCDDGLDNVPHMFLEPESRERALMLLEELARRYGQRWIVGGYDVLNEPISIPRWHHLTPELEAFYDEAVRRIRRHDKNHLLFLEGPVFATDTRMFKKNFDPECSNWALSVHMYSFRPEKRSLFKFLEVSRRLNVPVWIGEGKSNNIDMCGFYEIAARGGHRLQSVVLEDGGRRGGRGR